MKAHLRLENRPTDRNGTRKSLVLVCAVWLVIGGLGAVSSFATPLPAGSVLNNYAVVSVGPTASIMVNSGPITGNVLLGDGTTSSSSGGGNGQVTGTVDASPPVSGDDLSHIQIPPTIVIVPTSVGVQAFNDAVAASNAASALARTQTFGNVTGSLIINGNGGLNVIDINSLSNPDVVINGGANDNFVFNVSGNFQ